METEQNNRRRYRFIKAINIFQHLKDIALRNESVLNNPIANAFFWFTSFALAGYISAFGTKIIDVENISNWSTDKSVNLHTALSFACTTILAVFAFMLNIAKQFREEEHHAASLTAPPARYWGMYHQYFKDNTQAYDALEKSTAKICAQNKVLTAAKRLSKPNTLLNIYNKATNEENAKLSNEQPERHIDSKDAMNILVEKAATESIKNIEDIETFIRVTLKNIVNLVKQWDVTNIISGDVTFRANVMEVLYNSDPDDRTNVETEFNNNKEEFSKFCLYTVIEHYSGIVFLKDEKLTTTDASGNNPDIDRKPIYFGFTLQNDKDVAAPETYNILGAPMAVATNAVQYISATTSIAEDYEKKSTIKSAAIHKNLDEQYKRKDNPAHSIISIPISRDGFIQGKSTEKNTMKVKWVINIYRNQDGMLFNGRKTADFIDMASPFILLVGKALKLRDETTKSRIQ